MTKLATFVFVGLATLTLVGCGGDTLESLMDEGTDFNIDLTSVLAEVKDEASAKAALSKLEAFAVKGKELSERAQALGKPTPDQFTAMAEKAASAMAVMTKLETEVQRIKQNPELFKIVGDALDKAQSSLN